jgi:divalent metal cation (Fe/Co/Zn/Cd) transporter
MTAKPQQNTELDIRKGIRSSVIGVVINLSLALIKCLAGVIGHSFALIAMELNRLATSLVLLLSPLAYG